MKKLFIVDAVNFLFRSYYAIGPMTNPKGESTNALYGFIRSIYKLIKDFSPEDFVAVFDGPQSKQSRTAIYSEYKSHRAAMPEDLVKQLGQAHTFCELAGIPYLSISGVEADDTIGSITKWAEAKNADVFICTSDKDLCQLVSDHVFVINPHKNNLLIDRNQVKTLFDVYPEQIVDLLAMMGDASDNIPGLEGIGPKTAASLLNEFGTLDELLAHPERVSGKKQETLIQGREVALMSKRLASLQLDVEFPRDENFFHLKAPDLDRLKEFYHEMHFLSLLKELSPAETSTQSEKVLVEEGAYHLVDEEAALVQLIQTLQAHREICVDTETTDIRPMYAEIVGIGFGVAPKEAWYVPCNGQLGKQKVLSLLKPLLEDPKIGFIGHNIKYDMHVLANEGIQLAHAFFDTIVASYLLSPHVQRHNLDELSLEKFGKVKIPISDLIGKGKKQRSMLEVPLEQIKTYCCEDVDYTLRLKVLFEKELTKTKLTQLFHEMELPLLTVLFHMERRGIFVDVEKLKGMSIELNTEIKRIETEIFQLAGEEFNLNSPKQLSTILYEKLQIHPPKKTATGYSTAADVLESLQAHSPIIKKILEYRTLEKLRSTYVDALPEQIFPKTHRIHCTFNQSVAATGRLSSQDPNLQNIPVRTRAGKRIREAFRPQRPQDLFLSADYSQIELRLMAHLSEDPALIQAFQAGEDIHSFTASQVFGVPLAEVTSEMRYRAKAVNFGIIYGQQAFGLSQELGIDYSEAASFIETYFERYKRVKEFLQFCKESARQTGHSITLTGRLRPIPEINNKNPMIRAQAERLAINTPLQGTAADMIKIAMIQIEHLLLTQPELGSMILQIHDELLFEVPEGQTHALEQPVKQIMEKVIPLRVPLIVDISIGKNWSEC